MTKELHAILERTGKLAVALSGGVDSAALTVAACRSLGPERVLALHACSVFMPAREGADAAAIAAFAGCRLEVVDCDVLGNAAIAANPVDRCYHCKKFLMTTLLARAAELGFPVLADGANLDDASDYRPGARAADELGVRHPLTEAGMGKGEIRALARECGLFNAEAPAAACLASRIPYGTHIDVAMLRQVEEGEEFLRRLGCLGGRVRHHGRQARLEVDPADFPKVTGEESIVPFFRSIGFAEVVLDLAGYRRGSLNP